MSDFEDLVPELELCQLIPNGCFEKSVFGWRYTPRVGQGEFDWTVVIRDSRGVDCPAPTLQEILDDLWKFKPRVWRNKNLDPEVPAWGIALNEDNFIGHCGFVQDNPANAALKLWLRLNKSDQSDQMGKHGPTSSPNTKKNSARSSDMRTSLKP